MAATYGFLSTHPPTQCGLATFNSALAAHLTADGRTGGVVRVIGSSDDGARSPGRAADQSGQLAPSGPGVVHTWPAGSVVGWWDAAAALNGFDVAVVQHEYGIYPGPDGADILPLLWQLAVPSIVVLHTVLAQPTETQRQLLEEIVAAADAVVTMTDTARDRLLIGYTVDSSKVAVIPHGASDRAGGMPAETPQRPHMLTWGLLGPGKGIEWALRALARLRDLEPALMYTIAGRTHPKVLEHQGDAYRTGLHHLAALLGISSAVYHQPVYHDEAALGRLIRSADVVVLPYDSHEQVTSGVLIEAVAAGVPVVATPFPHAVELLTDGPGLLVPHGDAAALATAIRRVLTEPGLAADLTSRTHSLTPALQWPAVAARYEALAERLLTARPSAVPAKLLPA
jgi:glycosyltransferase involved in cell wall biosynthesis